MSGKFCTRCGAPVGAGSFCTSCGAAYGLRGRGRGGARAGRREPAHERRAGTRVGRRRDRGTGRGRAHGAAGSGSSAGDCSRDQAVVAAIRGVGGRRGCSARDRRGHPRRRGRQAVESGQGSEDAVDTAHGCAPLRSSALRADSAGVLLDPAARRMGSDRGFQQRPGQRDHRSEPSRQRRDDHSRPGRASGEDVERRGYEAAVGGWQAPVVPARCLHGPDTVGRAAGVGARPTRLAARATRTT